MHRRSSIRITLTLIGVLFTATLVWSQAQAPVTTAVRAGRLFDPKSGQMLANQVVLIQGDNYFLGADGRLMPSKPGQAPPDLRYFKQTQK